MNFNSRGFSLRDHPFKTSAFFRAVGVKNLPNLPSDSSKKTADSRGLRGKNREQFAELFKVDGPLFKFYFI